MRDLSIFPDPYKMDKTKTKSNICFFNNLWYNLISALQPYALRFMHGSVIQFLSYSFYNRFGKQPGKKSTEFIQTTCNYFRFATEQTIHGNICPRLRGHVEPIGGFLSFGSNVCPVYKIGICRTRTNAGY